MRANFGPNHNLLYRRACILAANEKQRIDTSGRQVSSVIVQCVTGVLDMYLGETEPDGLPDYRFQPGMGPQQIWLTEAVYLFVVHSTAGCRARVQLLGR